MFLNFSQISEYSMEILNNYVKQDKQQGQSKKQYILFPGVYVKTFNSSFHTMN